MAELPPCVTLLDHTADVGFIVKAGTLADLFNCAARGMMALVRGEDEPVPPPELVSRRARASDADAPVDDVFAFFPLPPAEHHIALEASEPALLLAAWLREVLYLHQSDGFLYGGARFRVLEGRRLVADVRGDPDPRPPVREIKGVTYHALSVEPGEDGWRARVIFDV